MTTAFILATGGLFVAFMAVASYVFYFSDKIHSDKSKH